MTEGGHLHSLHHLKGAGHAGELHHSTAHATGHGALHDHVAKLLTGGDAAVHASGKQIAAALPTTEHRDEIKLAGKQPSPNPFRTQLAELLTNRDGDKLHRVAATGKPDAPLGTNEFALKTAITPTAISLASLSLHTGGGGGTDATGSRDRGLFTPLNAGVSGHPFLNLAQFTPADTGVKRTGGGGGTGEQTLLAQNQIPAKPGEPLLTSAPAAQTEAASKLDPKLSQADLVKAGLIKDGTAQVSDRDYQSLKAGETPKISVVYENKDAHPNPPPAKPNYIVDKNGGVTMVHNPEGNPPDGQVVIQVQRDKGDVTKPTAQQQAALDDLVNYQGNRIVAQFGGQLPDVQTQNGPVKQVDINDPQGLVSDKVQNKFGDKLTPDALKDQSKAPPPVPPDVQDTSDRMNRVNGSNGSTTVPRESQPGRQEGDQNTPAGIDNMIPPREVPAPPSEPKRVVSFKDSVAALFNPDKTEPYSTVRERPGVGYQVGRYGMNQGFSMMGLAAMLGIDLGDPPDMAKLQEYLRQHPDALQKAMHQYADRLRHDADSKHLPADDKLRQAANNMDQLSSKFADPSFQQGFTKFLSDMKGGGDPITKDRVNQFMPKELQEALAEGGTKQLAQRMGIDASKMTGDDAGKLALGTFLGRAPTQEDLNNPQYQQYINAGKNMFGLADARQQSLGDINVTDAQGKIIMSANQSIGHAMWSKYMSDGNLGCAASVAAVLNHAGFSYANSLSVQGLEQQLLAHGWKRDSRAQPGDVVMGYRGGNSHGHTGIIGPNGQSFDNHSSSGRWSQDPASVWNNSRYSGGVHFLHPPG